MPWSTLGNPGSQPRSGETHLVPIWRRARGMSRDVRSAAKLLTRESRRDRGEYRQAAGAGATAQYLTRATVRQRAGFDADQAPGACLAH
jgi:hypothetical protein